MAFVTVPGGNGVTIAIAFSGADAVAAADALLQNIYEAPSQELHIFRASAGTLNQAAVPGDVNEFIDDLTGQIAVPNGYQYLVNDVDFATVPFGSGTAQEPPQSFIAMGTLDGASLAAGPSSLDFTAGTGTVNIVGGGNFTMGTRVSGGGGGSVLLDGIGTETLNLASGNWSVTTGTGTGSITLGSGSDTVVALGTDTVHGGSASAVVTMDGAGDVFIGGAGIATVVDNGTNDTITAGSGRETVFAQGNNLRISGGGAEVLLVDTRGGNTIAAGTSPIVAYGTIEGSYYSTGQGYFFFTSGGGSDTITASSGATAPIIFGSPNGHVQVQSSAAGNFVVAGAGNETIDAGASATGVTFFAGTGNADLIGGAGSNFFAASTGNTTMTGGIGNVYEVINGHAGATNTITHFGAFDLLYLSGYGLGSNSGIDSEIESNGTLALTLVDGTRILFDNIDSASALTGHIVHI